MQKYRLLDYWEKKYDDLLILKSTYGRKGGKPVKLRKKGGGLGLGLSLAWGLGVIACRTSEGPT